MIHFRVINRNMYQSKHSCSATIWDSAVPTCCPISDLKIWIFVRPLDSIVNQRDGAKFAGNIIGLLGLRRSVICFATADVGIEPPAIAPAEKAKNERLESFLSVIFFYLTEVQLLILRPCGREY